MTTIQQAVAKVVASRIAAEPLTVFEANKPDVVIAVARTEQRLGDNGRSHWVITSGVLQVNVNVGGKTAQSPVYTAPGHPALITVRVPEQYRVMPDGNRTGYSAFAEIQPGSAFTATYRDGRRTRDADAITKFVKITQVSKAANELLFVIDTPDMTLTGSFGVVFTVSVEFAAEAAAA